MATIVIMTNNHSADQTNLDRTLSDIGLHRDYPVEVGSNYIALIIGDVHKKDFKKHLKCTDGRASSLRI